MSEFTELLRALGSLAWPAILAVALWKFYEPLRAFIDSARGRRITLKVAGNELTVEEASEQQRQLLNDIQIKVADLQRRIDEQLPQTQLHPQPARDAEVSPVRTVLWVDDRPKNNSYLIASLQDMGASVKTVLSTAEALQSYMSGKFNRIVSDMGRPEGEKAGIDLVRRIRAIDGQVPIFIYCGGWAARNLKEEALAAGANGITSSSTTLLRMLRVDGRTKGG